MAITASVALSSSSVTAEQKVTATMTVSNSGGADVGVTAIAPFMAPTGTKTQSVAVAQGVVPLGGAYSVTVPASGTAKFSWDVIGHAPTSGFGNAMPSPFLYDVGAVVNTSDGAITNATVATLTVANPGH